MEVAKELINIRFPLLPITTQPKFLCKHLKRLFESSLGIGEDRF